MQYTLIFCFFMLSFSTVSQTTLYSNKNIDNLVEVYKIKNRETVIETYQIQILANENRIKIENCKQKFNINFPKNSIKKIHEAPYFKLITGAYLTRRVAEKQLKILKDIFPYSFIFRDRISITDLKIEKNL